MSTIIAHNFIYLFTGNHYVDTQITCIMHVSIVIVHMIFIYHWIPYSPLFTIFLESVVLCPVLLIPTPTKDASLP